MTQPPPPAGPGPEDQPPPYGGTYGQQQPYGQVPQGPSPYAQGQPYGGMPGQGAAGYGELAGRWARLGASLLDGLLVGVVTVVLSLPFVDWGEQFDASANSGPLYAGDLTINLISFTVGFLYYWLMHARDGQTLGKKALGIRVVREQDGGAIGSGTAAWRYGVQILLALPCGLGSLLDALWIFFDQRKQTLHDKAAHTLVVKVEPGMPNPYDKR
jgi:uncharacterized RDD family membrane protein YckC